MSPANAMENDKKRLRNQFTKDERIHLLNIMNEYGPLLDDKNISILSRKEIWGMIESKFNKGVHPERSSSQLKKYWQNYKYHSKRTGVIQKENQRLLSPTTKQVFKMIAKVDPEKWGRYGVVASQKGSSSCFIPVTAFKARTLLSEKMSRSRGDPEDESNQYFPTSLAILKTSPSSTFQSPRKPEEAQKVENSIRDSCFYVPGSPTVIRQDVIGGKATSKMDLEGIDISRPEMGNETKKPNVVVSRTDISGSSVTVSVICPERSIGPKKIFWTRKHEEKTISEDCDNDDDVKWCMTRSSMKDRLPMTLEVPQEVTSNDQSQYGRMLSRMKFNATLTEKQTKHETWSVFEDSVERSSASSNESQSIFIDEGHHRMNVIGTMVRRKNESSENESSADTTKGTRDLCLLVPRQISNDEVMNLNRNEYVFGVPKKTIESSAASESEKMVREVKIDADPKVKLEENLRSSCNSLNLANGTEVPRVCSFSVGDEDSSELEKFLLNFSRLEELKRTRVINRVKKIVGSLNPKSSVILEGDWKSDMLRNSSKGDDHVSVMDLTRKDLIIMKHLLKPLADAEESTRKSYVKSICECIVESFNEDFHEKGVTTGEDFNPENSNVAVRKSKGGNEEVKKDNISDLEKGNVTLETRRNLEEHVGQEVKTKMDNVESNVTSMSSASLETIDTINPMDILTQAKLQNTNFELDHQLELQKLETEEKRLKVKIAEMAIQETLLRIQSLNEDRRRAYELHELRLAQMAVKEGRRKSEYTTKTNTSKMAANERSMRNCPKTMFHSTTLDQV